jgi:hypothetical protein
VRLRIQRKAVQSPFVWARITVKSSVILQVMSDWTCSSDGEMKNLSERYWRGGTFGFYHQISLVSPGSEEPILGTVNSRR